MHFKDIYLAPFYFLQATTLGRESSPMELFVEMYVQTKDRQKGVQQFIDNHAEQFDNFSFYF